ncbi:PXA domain-containing protein [Macrophomina phaseolina]|uniref:PXA domain-containing protein n=1 Tax=Macrophomina phaseolina TaxID=35725 RepID=A0ABQ8G9H4_9PEZI|nr:PXA domain-containing protein [Macrophomina phaseolina]
MPQLPPRTSNSPQLPLSKPNDAVSDKATAAFVRRTLCAHKLSNNILATGETGKPSQKPLDELLPPLTSSNEVDLQLYGIIAVVIKEFVYAWYAKITPDHVFVDEVIQIIAHCTRALEQRLRKVDLEALILDEIPRLALQHIEAYRTSCRTSENHALASGYRQIYHTLCPHPALTPVPSEADPATILEQRENEASWRQLLVQGVLAVLLPTEDLENACLRALVAEILSEMIIGGGVSNKVCEPWMLWEAVEKAVEVLRPRVMDDEGAAPRGSEAGPKATSRLEQFGLLSAGSDEAIAAPRSDGWAGWWAIGDLSSLFWTVCQYAFLAFTALRAIVAALAASPGLPERSALVSSPMEGSRQSLETSLADDEPWPILSMSAWTCAGQLLELQARMPWLAGVASLLHWGAVSGPARVGGTNGPLDRLLSHEIRSRLLNPALLPLLLRTLRTSLFPNNAPGPPRVPPTPDEELAIKRRAARAVLDATPVFWRKRIFCGGDEEGVLQKQVERLLDVLGDPYLNKHLVFGIVELVVVRLLPEMGEMGVEDLIGERLG